MKQNKLKISKEQVFRAEIRNNSEGVTKDNMLLSISVIPEGSVLKVKLVDGINFSASELKISKGSFDYFKRCMLSIFEQIEKEKK